MRCSVIQISIVSVAKIDIYTYGSLWLLHLFWSAYELNEWEYESRESKSFKNLTMTLKILASIPICPLAKQSFWFPGYYAVQLGPWNHYWNLP